MSEVDELLAVTPQASPDPASTTWVPLWNMGIPSPGPVTTRVYRSTAQALPTGAFTPIAFDTARYDANGMWSAANPTRLTCKVAGTYAIWGEIQMTQASGGAHRLAQIYLNGAAEIACMGLSGMPSISAASGPRSEASAVVQLQVGDYVELRGYQDSGGNLNALASDNASLRANTEFSMALLQPQGLPGGPVQANRVKAVKTANMSVANAWASILWDAEEFDTDGFHDTVTNPDRITIPPGLAGNYLVSLALYLGVNVASPVEVLIQKNATVAGTNVVAGCGCAVSTGVSQTPNAVAMLDLAVGDWLTALVYSGSATAQTIQAVAGVGHPTYFELLRIA